MKNCLYFTFLFILILNLFCCFRNEHIKKPPVAKNGILDLMNWDFAKGWPGYIRWRMEIYMDADKPCVH